LYFCPCPPLIRETIAGLGGLAAEALWIPSIVLVVAVNYTILKIFKRTISEPLLHIAQEIELNKPGSYAFKSTSRNEEEKALKHFVESQSLRSTEMETQIDDLENERDHAKKDLEVALEKAARATQELEETLVAKAEIRETAERLKAKNTVFKQELDTERANKVGNEVQKRADEIYHQMERAVEAAAYKKIWLPSILEEVKTPAKLISDIATRIERSWDDTPLNKLKIEVEEINRHCDEQLRLLKAISNREAIAEAEIEERALAQNPAPKNEPIPVVEETIEAEPEPAIQPEATREQIEKEPPAANAEPSTEAEAPDDRVIDFVPEPELTPDSSPGLTEEPIIVEKPITTESPSEPIEFIPADPIPNSSVTNNAEENELDTALEELVAEIVEEYKALAKAFNIELTQTGLLDADVDEEEVGSILSNLLEIAINQFDSGAIRLKAEQTTSFLELTVRCDGKPNPDAGNDVTQANRIASAMDQKVAIDMQKDDALYMHLKYSLEMGDSFDN